MPRQASTATKRDSTNRSACDRCRGQKLRCIWSSRDAEECQRCQRANAVCVVPMPRPMGRPPRHLRPGNSHSRPNSSSEAPDSISHAAYAWPDDGISIPPAAFPTEDAAMTTGPIEHANDIFDFLNFFPNTATFSGVFSSCGLASTTEPLPPINSSRSLQAPGPFTNEGQSSAADRSAAMDETVQLLSQLCELNLALYRHPLHGDKDKARSQARSSSSESAGQASTQSTEDSTAWELSRSELGIGKLLEMTSQLKELVTRLRAAGEAQPPDRDSWDKSTALMVLSCYMRFDTLFTRAIDILRRVRNRTQPLTDIHELMPNLAIDGFSLSKCYDVHLDITIHLCEQTHERIKMCVQSGMRSLGTNDSREPLQGTLGHQMG